MTWRKVAIGKWFQTKEFYTINSFNTYGQTYEKKAHFSTENNIYASVIKKNPNSDIR